jgi:hypothetical protein
MNAEQIRSIPCEWCKDAACFRGVYMTHARFACHKHRDELRTAIMILSDLGDAESQPVTEQDILSDTRTCGELSCDQCNERFAAAQKVIAMSGQSSRPMKMLPPDELAGLRRDAQFAEPYQRLKAAIDRGMGCAGCERCLEDIEAEIAGMRRDAERLKWYAQHVLGIQLYNEAQTSASFFAREEPNGDDYLSAIRTAIDAARGSGEQ